MGREGADQQPTVLVDAVWSFESSVSASEALSQAKSWLPRNYAGFDIRLTSPKPVAFQSVAGEAQYRVNDTVRVEVRKPREYQVLTAGGHRETLSGVVPVANVAEEPNVLLDDHTEESPVVEKALAEAGFSDRDGSQEHSPPPESAGSDSGWF